MKTRRTAWFGALVVMALATDLGADPGAGASDPSPTHFGLTGLFNLISPDTLDRGQVTLGFFHRNYDRELTDIDVNDAVATLGAGLTDRLEVGIAYVGYRQMDFDDRHAGAFYNGFPLPISEIRGGGGDLSLGFKYALARMEERGNGFSLLARVKAPTAREAVGRGTGGWDVMAGAAGGMVRGKVGLHGNLSFTFVGDLDAPEMPRIDLANVIGYGAGLELGAGSWLRAIVEVTGESFIDENRSYRVSGRRLRQQPATDLALGFKAGGAGHGGFALGAAYVRNLAMDSTGRLGQATRPNGWIAELSYTSSAAPVPPPVAPAAADEAPINLNHAPTCTLHVGPGEVYASATGTVATASVQAADPDGDVLSYAWSTSGGTIRGSGASVSWLAPGGVDEASFTITARISDGRGGEAMCAGTVALKIAPESFAGRVQFEFDRYDLSDAARLVIQSAADHMRRFPNLRVTLEGHCCAIGTDEYNLQLGQHRAEAIRADLVSRGVDAARISTISYGEAKPFADNAREITRRLNRRGEFGFKFSE